MHPISASQIRAARAYLGWTQDELAAATGLSAKTIRNLEMGFVSPRSETNAVVRAALENKGIDFPERGGIYPRPDDLFRFSGPDGCDQFFADLLRTVRQRGGEIAAVVRSQDALAEMCGASPRDSTEWIAQLNSAGPVKCVLSELPAVIRFPPSFQFRINPNQTFDKGHEAVASFIFGDKFALVTEESGFPKFIVIQSMAIANDRRNSFLEFWSKAVPILIQPGEPPVSATHQRARA